jgi:hypothetical protein
LEGTLGAARIVLPIMSWAVSQLIAQPGRGAKRVDRHSRPSDDDVFRRHSKPSAGAI